MFLFIALWIVTAGVLIYVWFNPRTVAFSGTSQETANEESGPVGDESQAEITLNDGQPGTVSDSGANGTATAEAGVSATKPGEPEVPLVEANTVLRETEVQDWAEHVTDTTHVYAIYNENVAVTGKVALIHLMNPVYSTYSETVKIYSATDNTEVYYQSEYLAPGTVLEAINLNRNLSTTPMQMVMEFTFYDASGKTIGKSLEAAVFAEQ